MNPDFHEMLSALSAEHAEFLVVGAYAVAVHGLPRATGDLDVWVRRDGENPARVRRALERFGAPLDELAPDDLGRPDVVFQVGIEPRRIDILTSIDGVEFGEAWTERVDTDIGGLVVPVISRAMLIRNKRATGRPQDLADVARLERQEGG